jgi:type I restriction enzyme S subunit
MTPRQPLFDRPLPDGWQLLTVDDIKAPDKHSCVAGPFGSNISSKYFVESGVPVIRGNNLRDDLTRFVPTGFAFVSEEQAQRYKAQHVRPGDLVFTCWGTLGQVGLIPENGPYPEYIISNKQLKLRPNREICNVLYLFYFFGSPQMVGYVRRIASSAAVPGINLALLKSFQIALPPLDIQERIASILSGYDDLIENNTRRIAILEEMARALYQEWFVHFRFPSHEHMPLVDSPLGPIPDGWEVGKLEHYVELAYGKALKADDRLEGPFPVYGSSGVVGYHSSSLVDGPGIIVGRKGNVGSVHWSDDPFYPIDTVYYVRSELPLHYVYFNFTDQHLINNDSAVPGLNRKQAYSLPFLLPPPEHVTKFREICGSFFELRRKLRLQNSNLRTTRDLLLPRLISGEIDVSALPEEPIAEAAD